MVERSLQEFLRNCTKVWSCEHRFLDHENHWIWVRQSGKVIERDAAGRPRIMVGTTRRIQEQYSILALFEGSEAFLNILRENLPIAFIFLDSQGTVLLESKAAIDLFGKLKGLSTRSTDEVPIPRKDWEPHFHRAMSGETTNWQHDLPPMYPFQTLLHQFFPVKEKDRVSGVLEVITTDPDDA